MRDFDFKDKNVLVRCDFNSPLDKQGVPIEFMRIRVYRPTFAALKDARRIVAISHQGRKGNKDCVSLANHAKILDQALDTHKVIFCGDTTTQKAMEAIKNVNRGEVLILENTRFLEEDNVNIKEGEALKSRIVDTLSPHFDIFINDAFSVSHRKQPSVAGFPMVLPSCAGMVVEREMEAMNRARRTGRRPAIYVVGGMKLKEVVALMENSLYQNTIDKFLLGGSVAFAFLYVRDLAPKETLIVIEESGDVLEGLLNRIRELDVVFRDRIELPVDVAISYGGREEVAVTDPLLRKYPVMDLGEKTIRIYTEEIMRARAVFSKGPMGYYENPTFMKGTVRILIAMERSNAFSLIGGGHMGNVAFDLGIATDHTSTAGGAVLGWMSGKPLEGIESLKNNLEEFTDEKVGKLLKKE